MRDDEVVGVGVDGVGVRLVGVGGHGVEDDGRVVHGLAVGRGDAAGAEGEGSAIDGGGAKGEGVGVIGGGAIGGEGEGVIGEGVAPRDADPARVGGGGGQVEVDVAGVGHGLQAEDERSRVGLEVHGRRVRVDVVPLLLVGDGGGAGGERGGESESAEMHGGMAEGGNRAMRARGTACYTSRVPRVEYRARSRRMAESASSRPFTARVCTPT